MSLVDKYPGKVQFFQYNTGGMGEILNEYMEGSIKKKQLVRKVTRVPIDLMAAIQRGDLRGSNKYQKGIFGTEEIVNCEGYDLNQYDPLSLYSQEQIDKYLSDIVDGRRKFTERIANQGLKPEIVKFAEESFQIAKSAETKKVFIPEKSTTEEKVDFSQAPKTWVSKVRPPRPVGY